MFANVCIPLARMRVMSLKSLKYRYLRRYGRSRRGKYFINEPAFGNGEDLVVSTNTILTRGDKDWANIQRLWPSPTPEIILPSVHQKDKVRCFITIEKRNRAFSHQDQMTEAKRWTEMGSGHPAAATTGQLSKQHASSALS